MESNTIPSQQGLQREEQRLAEQHKEDSANGVPHFDSRRAVTDPVITPFVRAMVAEGYEIKKTPHGGCDLLERCPSCNGSYRFTFIKSAQEIKLCAHCKK